VIPISILNVEKAISKPHIETKGWTKKKTIRFGGIILSDVMDWNQLQDEFSVIVKAVDCTLSESSVYTIVHEILGIAATTYVDNAINAAGRALFPVKNDVIVEWKSGMHIVNVMSIYPRCLLKC